VRGSFRVRLNSVDSENTSGFDEATFATPEPLLLGVCFSLKFDVARILSCSLSLLSLDPDVLLWLWQEERGPANHVEEAMNAALRHRFKVVKKRLCGTGVILKKLEASS